GVARVTIPARGTLVEAQRFTQENARWLEREALRLASRPTQPKAWQVGSRILYRGEWIPLQFVVHQNSQAVQFGDQILPLPAMTDDLRPLVEKHFQRIAKQELPLMTRQLAAIHSFDFRKVIVRNQRSRWGSCSRQGTISLNWRLVQTPECVRDYIILHELAH